jgi:class 3 adenylate cyclase
MDTPETNIDRLLKARAEINEQLRQHKANLAVLFTDVVASTKYFDRYGDTAGLAMVDRHAQLGARTVREFDGRVVKTIGDSVMAEFADCIVCVQAAIELQRKLYGMNEKLPERDRLQLRIGINYGSCFRQDGDLFGDAVNVAARITKHTGPGQILISSSVHRGILKDSSLICSSLGTMDFKGKEEREEIFEVLWTDPMTYSNLRTSNTAAVACGELVAPGLRVEDLAEPPEDLALTSPAQSPMPRPVKSDSSPAIRADRASVSGHPDPPPRIETGSHRTPSHSSNFGYEARYVPGATLADRYRIVSPLGKGGMGEVYRAEDLKLGQPVALKFLPASLLRNADAVERFHREVRLARQVSHPNVCRVFDLGEGEGATAFISMEYVDGEDLSSLMRRIGRVPADKALDIAKQICAGLAAAHEYGIIHRDLKPANIMLDGRGRVRIMDFGLAAVSLDAPTDDARAGTPAYMSPEQIAGGEITAQSDLYSLGLVLYEIFTGKRPFEAKTFDEMIRQRERSTPTLPSHYVKEIDPIIERVILRCLERDPTKRSASALQVAAALPGGDPLAAALAAGETPSPEMVAAAGEEGTLQPWKAWMLMSGIAVLLACCTAISQHGSLVNLLPGDKSPEVLSATAREIARGLGYTERPADSAYWFDQNSEYAEYLAQIPAPERYRRVSEDFPSPLRFFYRQSPKPLTPYYDGNWVVQKDNPVPTISGDMTICVDTEGRLQSFRVIPFPYQENVLPTRSSVGWAGLFERAGLDFSRAKTAASDWYTNQMMDQQYAWDVIRDGESVQVRGGTNKGGVVLFEVLGPWDHPTQTEAAQPVNRYVRWFAMVLLIGPTLVCLLIARKNMRTGRGDSKGALRGAVAIFLLVFFFMLLAPHHSSDPRWISQWWQIMIGESAGLALQWWLYYMALEPYMRRTYPQALISWSRLLAGNPRDVLVGRDVLLGVGFGMLTAILDALSDALPAWFPIKGVTPTFAAYPLGGIAAYAATFVSKMAVAMLMSILSLTIVFLAWKLFRSKTVGLVAAGCLFAILAVQSENIWFTLIFGVLTGSVLVLCLSRSGLLGLAVALYTWFMLGIGALTTDFSRWYAPRCVAAMLVIIAIAAYGFWTSTSGRRRFGTAFED